MEDYESCIKDIDLCLQAKYPEKLKPKVYIRKAQCFKKLGEPIKMRKILMEVLTFLDESSVLSTSESEKYKEVVKNLITTRADRNIDVKNDCNILPTLESNPLFLNASASVALQFKKHSRSQVVAKKEIMCGDVLFVEKAYSFAPLFKEGQVFYKNYCQNCLVQLTSCVPCKTCVKHLYCTEKCRSSAWKKFHQWECIGLQTELFPILGFGYLALRIILAAAHAGLPMSAVNLEDGMTGTEDAYAHVYNFPIEIDKLSKENLMNFAATAAGIVHYLKLKTDFFSYLKKWPAYRNKSEKELMNKVGGLIIRHCAQVCCIYVGVKHFDSVNIVQANFAAAICPSMAMMSHSCVPNTSQYFVGDTVVVKAIKNIKTGEEVHRAYADITNIVMHVSARQKLLQEACHLKCKCHACVKPKMDLYLCDAYVCIKCKGSAIADVKQVFTGKQLVCFDCNQKFVLPRNVLTREKLSNELYHRFMILKDLNLANQCLEMCKGIYKPNHTAFLRIYGEMVQYYIEEGDFKSCIENIKIILDLTDRTYGSRHLKNAVNRFLCCIMILQELKKRAMTINLDCFEDVLRELWNFIKEAKFVSNLHCPSFTATLEKVEKSVLELQTLHTVRIANELHNQV